MTYLLTDSEYTTWPGALESGWAADWQHREIFQMGAVLTDDQFNEIDSLVLLVKPTINRELSEFAQTLTNISQLQIEEFGVGFSDALAEFSELAARASAVICMNGDSGVFRENCEINHVPFPFKRDFHRLRPFLESKGVDLSQLSSGDLHTLTPTPIVGHTHDALHDCRSMAVWLKDAKQQGVFVAMSELSTEIPKEDPRSEVRPLNR